MRIRRVIELGSTGVGSAEGFHIAMAEVDAAGWDGDVEQEVLRYRRAKMSSP